MTDKSIRALEGYSDAKGVKATQLEGDVAVGRNVALGGGVLTQGSGHIKGNLRVDGWIDATNIRGGENGGRLDDKLSELEDLVQDARIQVYVTSSRGLAFKNGTLTTVLEARVMQGVVDLTNRLPMGAFSWKRLSGNMDADSVWNRSHEGVGYRILLTADEVDHTATFDVEIRLDMLQAQAIGVGS